MGEDVQMNMQKIDLVDELMRKVIFRDDEEAFCQLFYDLFPPLCAFAHRYVEEKETCEDIVQEVFFRIWKNRRHIDIQVSARNFLITLNPQLHSRSATYIKRNGLLIRKITIKSSRPFQCAYHPLTP